MNRRDLLAASLATLVPPDTRTLPLRGTLTRKDGTTARLEYAVTISQGRGVKAELVGVYEFVSEIADRKGFTILPPAFGKTIADPGLLVTQ